ncbi:MAG: glycosyltransferase [Cyanobacteria bacterium SID2]|nr:glycosyltransferase [Cyanobacteria bacterium SID2]
MEVPQITIVVSPRERFSYTRESLESIYQHTKIPFSLVYVDGGSPKDIAQYLRDRATDKGFQLVRSDRYLSPNQARNLGLKYVKSQYVVFIDNDVHVTPGWLERLVQCADETEASIVAPLTCIGKPLHQTIHLAGGEARIVLEVKGEKIRRRVHEKHYFVNRPLSEVCDRLRRQPCEFAEFHCMLVRTEVFDRVGPLDEALLSTREHIDFCLTVTHAGGTIYCEPSSIVTYVPDRLQTWADISYFMLRWSDAWEIESLQHFQNKWNLKKDKYFKKRYNRLGYRRHQAFLKPWVRQMTLGQRVPWLEKIAIAIERTIDRYMTDCYARRYRPIAPTARPDFTRPQQL